MSTRILRGSTYDRAVIRALDLGLIPYSDYLALARALVPLRAADQVPDLLLYAVHPPVITLGLSSEPGELLESEAALAARGFTIEAIERGGHTTYHGPDQQMLYPVRKLEDGALHGFVRALQEVVALACEPLGITAFRREGYPGVWTERGKLASLGIALKQRVSLHGIALNCDPPDSGGFDAIIPCGLEGIAMTHLAQESAFPVPRLTIRALLATAWETVFREPVRMIARAELPEPIQALVPEPIVPVVSYGDRVDRALARTGSEHCESASEACAHE